MTSINITVPDWFLVLATVAMYAYVLVDFMSVLLNRKLERTVNALNKQVEQFNEGEKNGNYQRS